MHVSQNSANIIIYTSFTCTYTPPSRPSLFSVSKYLKKVIYYISIVVICLNRAYNTIDYEKQTCDLNLIHTNYLNSTTEAKSIM